MHSQPIRIKCSTAIFAFLQDIVVMVFEDSTIHILHEHVHAAAAFAATASGDIVPGVG